MKLVFPREAKQLTISFTIAVVPALSRFSKVGDLILEGMRANELSSHNSDSTLYVAVVIEKVSVRSLQKTGVFPSQAGDFREILAEVARLQRQNR